MKFLKCLMPYRLTIPYCSIRKVTAQKHSKKELQTDDSLGKNQKQQRTNFVPATTLAILIILVTCAMAVNPVRTASATFPGIDGKIAFTSNRDGKFQIYVMNADGSGQTRLTNNGASDDSPSWSPDGSKIAFTSNRDGNNKIYVMNADGSGQTRLTNNSTSDDNPSWSPDGTKIAFSRGGYFSAVYIMNADGSGQTRLTDNSAADMPPKWSPDGTKIAFVSNREGGGRVYVMNADGSGQVKISGGGSHSDSYPDWSPDGKKIVFTSAGRGGRPCCNLFTMNADGTNITGLDVGIYFDFSPSWSPDGTKIAFAGSYSGPQGNLVINAMNSDGSSLKQLTTNESINASPNWGPQPTAPKQAKITVESIDQSGNSLLGMYTVIRSVADGTILKTGFTPLTFTGNTGTAYEVSVANYGGMAFKHWEDGSTSNTRTVHLFADTTTTAAYDRGNSQSGFTPFTYNTGTSGQPVLTVNATTTTIGGSLRMWTIIDPQLSSVSAGTTTPTTTTYKVYATDGYQNLVFDHWGDNGSKDRVRTLTIDRNTTITAYYRITQ
jgi:TolB protein